MPFDSTPPQTTPPQTRNITITPAHILTHALTLLTNKGWCQDVGAKDACGLSVPGTNPEAAAFCAIGAIDRAYHDLHATPMALSLAENILRNCIGKGTILNWNDQPHRTKSQVLAKFRQAIKNATQYDPKNRES